MRKLGEEFMGPLSTISATSSFKLKDLLEEMGGDYISPSDKPQSPKTRERVSPSVVSNSVTPWTVAFQAPLSVAFFRQEYWSGLPFPSPGNLPYPWIEPRSLVPPALQADSSPSEPLGKPQTRAA